MHRCGLATPGRDPNVAPGLHNLLGLLGKVTRAGPGFVIDHGGSRFPGTKIDRSVQQKTVKYEKVAELYADLDSLTGIQPENLLIAMIGPRPAVGDVRQYWLLVRAGQN